MVFQGLVFIFYIDRPVRGVDRLMEKKGGRPDLRRRLLKLPVLRHPDLYLLRVMGGVSKGDGHRTIVLFGLFNKSTDQQSVEGRRIHAFFTFP